MFFWIHFRNIAILLMFLCLMTGSDVFAKTIKGTNKKYNKTSKRETRKRKGAKSNFSGEWKFGLGSGYVSDEINKQNISGIFGSAKINYGLHPAFAINLEPFVGLNSGQAQSLYGEFESGNSIGVNEASVFWTPFEFVDMSAGILNQRRIDNQLLIKNTTFPGIYGRIYFIKHEDFTSNVEAEGAIPTSYTMNSQARELEKTPVFYAQTLRFGFRPGKRLNGELWLTHFTFENLPSTVAKKSNTLGNTVTNNYDFDYKFDGISAGAKTTIPLYDDILDINLGARLLKNNKAPEGLNAGHELSGELKISTMYEIDLRPRISLFRNEPDASPAYYNSSEYGNSNRHGYAYGIGVVFNRWNFKLNGKYIDSHLIYRDPFQAHRRTIKLTLETLDVRF